MRPLIRAPRRPYQCVNLTEKEYDALVAAVALAEVTWADDFDYPDTGKEARARARALQRAFRKIQADREGDR